MPNSTWQMVFSQKLRMLPGYQRLNAGAELLKALHKNGSGTSSTLIWALGRLCEQHAGALLFNKYLKHEDELVRSATALALLRIGDLQAVDHCLRSAHAENWPLLPLGLSGSRSTVPALLKRATEGNVSADCLIALGLLGDISAIDTLLPKLANDEMAESAALALNLVTGAELTEEAFIPEEIEEDELFEEELEKLKKGEALYPLGEEPGTTLSRISQNLEDWQKWWAENKSRFNPEIRYRNGKPYSPACLLENLESEKSPHKVTAVSVRRIGNPVWY